MPRCASIRGVHLDTVLEPGGWKPPEPAARMAALRSARFQRAGRGIFQMPRPTGKNTPQEQYQDAPASE
jgi:hypothetical protein